MPGLLQPRIHGLLVFPQPPVHILPRLLQPRLYELPRLLQPPVHVLPRLLQSRVYVLFQFAGQFQALPGEDFFGNYPVWTSTARYGTSQKGAAR